MPSTRQLLFLLVWFYFRVYNIIDISVILVLYCSFWCSWWKTRILQVFSFQFWCDEKCSVFGYIILVLMEMSMNGVRNFDWAPDCLQCWWHRASVFLNFEFLSPILDFCRRLIVDRSLHSCETSVSANRWRRHRSRNLGSYPSFVLNTTTTHSSNAVNDAHDHVHGRDPKNGSVPHSSCALKIHWLAHRMVLAICGHVSIDCNNTKVNIKYQISNNRKCMWTENSQQ